MKIAIDLEGKVISGLGGVMGVKNSFGQKLAQVGYQKQLSNFHEIEVDTSMVNGTADHVVIPKSYLDELENESQVLSYLEAYGVDNWQGYGDAMSAMREDTGEEN